MAMAKKDMEKISNSRARKEMENLQKKASSGDKEAKKMLEKDKKKK
ncbi:MULTISPECIES: hypothetical protein [unclassified Methanosarcina]|jgi:hypothetical protein|nr:MULTISPECIES: hypothetical protein [unclassified Methanosarcina]